MTKPLVFIPQTTPVMTCAARELALAGWEITDAPRAGITHLLLPVPCRLGSEQLQQLLNRIEPDVTVLGGFLNRPELQGFFCLDLLKDESYQAENAMITAYCALQIGQSALPLIWNDCPVLILGWGRIGKCLSKLLQELGAQVTVAARKETDLSMIAALGLHPQPINALPETLPGYRIVFNTVPHLILPREKTSLCRPDCVLVELASSAGMDADRIVDGRGLPGKLAPESAGKLIARTVLRLCDRKEEAL